MTRERTGMWGSLMHGLVGWGAFIGIVGGILLIRLHVAQTGRALLPSLPATISAEQQRAWKSFPSYRNVVPVLVYHSVGGPPSYLTVSRPLFAQQMLALKLGGFHTLTARQYAAYVRGQMQGLPARPIMLTFDDGRLDAYRAATPILQEYGFHATEFAVPGWVTAHPNFSLSWPELDRMSRSGVWDIQLHFGYGQQNIRVDKDGDTGPIFGYREYIATGGQQGHLETFRQFQRRFSGNDSGVFGSYISTFPATNRWQRQSQNQTTASRARMIFVFLPTCFRGLAATSILYSEGTILTQAKAAHFRLPADIRVNLPIVCQWARGKSCPCSVAG